MWALEFLFIFFFGWAKQKSTPFKKKDRVWLQTNL